jgi:hypothetical protein
METKSKASQEQSSSGKGGIIRAKHFLSHRQRQAIPSILGAPSITEAARRSGVSRSQLYRWLRDDPYFRAELRRQSEECAAMARARLKGLAHTAADAWADCLRSKDERVKLAAAKSLFDLIGKVPDAGEELPDAPEIFSIEHDQEFLHNRVEAMVETALLNAPATLKAVVGLEPTSWQQIVFGTPTRAELLDVVKEAGCFDFYGILQAALMCLGMLAACFDPEAVELCANFIHVSASDNYEKRSEASKRLKKKLRGFILPPVEETDPHIEVIREAIQIIIDRDRNVDVEDFPDHNFSEPCSTDMPAGNEAGDPGPSPEAPEIPRRKYCKRNICVNDSSNSETACSRPEDASETGEEIETDQV